MSNFKTDIEEALAGESVEGIVVGKIVSYYDDERDQAFPAELRGTVQSWEAVAPYLDYEYDDGYGGQDCQSIWLWTSTRVLFVAEYDGSTHIASVPRHPRDAGEDEPESI